MWSSFYLRPIGNVSIRQFTLFVLAVLMVLFAGITTGTAYAQEPAGQQVTGTEESITYNSKTYTKLDPIPKTDPTFEVSACGAPTITSAYIRFNRPEPSQAATGAEVVCSKDFTTGEAVIVVFPNAQVAAGSDQVSSFGTITASERDDIVAIQKRYDLKGLPSSGISESQVKDPSVELPAVAGDKTAYEALYKKFNENIQHEEPITIGTPGSTGSSTITSCDSLNTHGLGWIICPVTNWLAAGMDQFYEILSSFLVVSPLTTDRSGVLYYMWGVMQNIANVLFIISFLIIIYSQITGAGISNYGIKRMLPRLVIAAVLVNVSYWVTAIAVDLSNLLGQSLQNLFNDIRNNIPASETQEVGSVSWKALAGAALSGSTAAFAIGGAAAGVVVSAGGSLWFLLVALAGVMVSALVAILVLAARQALITILVIISPLAFVAFLLPSTEKYFDRWRGLLTTMLLMFPLFSLVFGGANLAGVAIIYSADPRSANYWNIVILGMIVQIAPVIITPLLIKLSGSLLGRVAGIVNDPNKGLVDKTRKFAQNRHDMTKNRQLWDRDVNDPKKFANNNPFAQLGRRKALRDIDNSHRLKAWESGAEATYARDHRAHDTHRQSEINSMNKNVGDQTTKRDFAREIATKEALQTLDATSRKLQEEASLAENKNKSFYEAIQAKPSLASTAIRNIGGDAEAARAFESLAQGAQQVAYDTRKESDRQTNIANAVSDAYQKEMVDNEDWRKYAGADGISEHGQLRAKATAQSKIMSASNERVENYKRGFIFDNIDKNAVREKANGRNIADNEEWEAAINYVAESKDTDNIIKHHQEINLTTAPASIRQTFELAYKNSSAKPVYATAGKLGEIGQGLGLREDGDGKLLVTEWQIDASRKGKYSTSGMVRSASKEELERLADTLAKISDGRGNIRGFTAEQAAAQRLALEQAFKDKNYRAELGDKEVFLRQLGRDVFGIQEEDFNDWKRWEP